MNDTTRLDVCPEVVDFLDQVRARLSDLTEEQRDDLLGGLEADLSELVADGGSVAELGDPRAYADELRAAAGVEPTGEGIQWAGEPRRSTPELVHAVLDEARSRWDSAMSRPSLRSSWEVVGSLAPAWWVLRGWVAAQLVDIVAGPWENATILPRLGDDVTGKLVLVGAIVVSVLVGLRKTWPASHSPGSAFARLVLLGLNGFATAMLLFVVSMFPSAWTLHHAWYGMVPSDFDEPGLVNDGRVVRNVFAYDAEGNPLQGVQLYDQTGEPLAVDPGMVRRMRYEGRLPSVLPWRNGNQDIWHVYPLPVRFDHGWERSAGTAWESDDPAFVPNPPLAAVPPLSLPLPEAASPEAP